MHFQNNYAEALNLIDSLSEKLMGRGMLLGTAESCTGGLIAALCTELPGSSRWFAGGVVAYSNAMKHALLGVDEGLLERRGAVSEESVRAMAGGALHRLGVDLALAVSGIAGPDGGSADKPVGTVWIAVASQGGLTSGRHLFSGGRDMVRRATAIAGLEALGRALGKPFSA